MTVIVNIHAERFCLFVVVVVVVVVLILRHLSARSKECYTRIDKGREIQESWGKG